MLSVPRIKEFLKENVPLLLRINMRDLKRRKACIAELLVVDEPEDYEKAYHELLQFVRELIHFCRLEFYLVKPHNLPGLRNLNKPGRPRKQKDAEPIISGEVLEVEEEREFTEDELEMLNSIPTTEDEVKVAEWGMELDKSEPPPRPKPTTTISYTNEMLFCDSCGFKGNFKIASGFPICPNCGYNPHA